MSSGTVLPRQDEVGQADPVRFHSVPFTLGDEATQNRVERG